MMFNVHSKVAFSVFTSSKLKRRVEKEVFTYQFGSKKAGAESMIHVMQHVPEQSPDFDVFSADAVKAFYNLNRDLALKKFKEKCPVFFNMFMDKHNKSSNAFFNALAQGVLKFNQTEGGSPGAVEMNFMCSFS